MPMIDLNKVSKIYKKCEKELNYDELGELLKQLSFLQRTKFVELRNKGWEGD